METHSLSEGIVTPIVEKIAVGLGGLFAGCFVLYCMAVVVFFNVV